MRFVPLLLALAVLPAAENPVSWSFKTVLVQRESERGRSPLVSIPPFGRGFLRHGGLSIRCSFERVREENSRARDHRLDEPPSYPSAWLHPCRARFRFTWQDHCNSSPVESDGFCCVLFAAC